MFEGHGLLLRGASGSGKSLLALHLIDSADSQRGQTALISDDLVDVGLDGDLLMLNAPSINKGLIELRFFGPVRREQVDRSELHLVVDFVEELTRLPMPEEFSTYILDRRVPRLALMGYPSLDLVHQALLVRAALSNNSFKPEG